MSGPPEPAIGEQKQVSATTMHYMERDEMGLGIKSWSAL
jgi:hypothetical protein